MYMNDERPRAIVEKDLKAVAELHAICFDDPWGVPILKSILEPSESFGLLIRKYETLASFILFRSVAKEGEILSLAVAPNLRREGLAISLLQSTIIRAGGLGLEQIFLEVAMDNQAAQKLYDRFAFKQVGVRKDYYKRFKGPNIDALTLKLNIS